jgi:hypothetical protein
MTDEEIILIHGKVEIEPVINIIKQIPEYLKEKVQQ